MLKPRDQADLERQAVAIEKYTAGQTCVVTGCRSDGKGPLKMLKGINEKRNTKSTV